MLKHQDAIAERRAHAIRLAHKERRPFGAVIHQLDRSVMHPHHANTRRLDLFFSSQMSRSVTPVYML
jgi:hypothetical protein